MAGHPGAENQSDDRSDRTDQAQSEPAEYETEENYYQNYID
jgi:hypothetical protein